MVLTPFTLAASHSARLTDTEPAYTSAALGSEEAKRTHDSDTGFQLNTLWLPSALRENSSAAPPEGELSPSVHCSS
jgi:hypothetical protein